MDIKNSLNRDEQGLKVNNKSPRKDIIKALELTQNLVSKYLNSCYEIYHI